MAISIHAPRAGSDLLFECIIPREMSFQSTLPVRGATGQDESGGWTRLISIHAPRAGSDSEDAQNGTVYFEQLS